MEEQINKDIWISCTNCHKSFNWSRAKIHDQLCEECLKQ